MPSWPTPFRRLVPVLVVVAGGVLLLAHLVTANLRDQSREVAMALAGRDLLEISEQLADVPAGVREEEMLALARLRGLRATTQTDCASAAPHRPLILAVTSDGRTAGTPGWEPPSLSAGADVFDTVLATNVMCSRGDALAVGVLRAVGDGRLFVGRVYQQDRGPGLLVYGVALAVLLAMAGALMLVHMMAARAAGRQVAILAGSLERSAEDRFRTRIPEEPLTGEIGQAAVHVNSLIDRAQAMLEELSHLQGYIAHDIGNPLLAARRIVAGGAADTPRDIQALRLQLDLAERRRRAVLNIISAQAAGDEDFHPVRPGERLHRLVEDMFAYLAEDKRLSFSIRADDSVVSAPPDVFDRMLENVLLNAVEHAEAGSVIRMTVHGADGRCRIDVANTGQTPAVDPDSLFGPGVRRGAVGGGHGLGLAFVRTAAGRLGGTVEAATLPEGFRVRFSLPLASGSTRSAPCAD